MEKKKKILLIILILVFLLIIIEFNIWSIRALSDKEIDDVHPKLCTIQDNYYINKSNILWIIPIYGNKSIADNRSWCLEILKMNKTLGLHGVYHTYQEYNEYRDQNYTNLGIVAFQDCFGFRPTKFKAPQLKINKENRQVLKSMELEIHGRSNQIMHKAYHCNDSGRFRNNFIDKF